MTTRSLNLNWKMRALHVLPMFLLPALSSLVYSVIISFTKMCKYFFKLMNIKRRPTITVHNNSFRLMSDISRFEAKVDRLEAQLSAKDREIANIIRTEAKAAAAFKAQIEKLQQERDEFQRMVIGNQN